jgi:hypothetical protein
MTIEEVSVLFDTGRKGDAAAAARHLENDKLDNDRSLSTAEVDDLEKYPKAKVVSHVE